MIPFHWMDVAIPIGLTGVWVFLFVRQYRSRALFPLNDPYFKEAFAMKPTDPGGHGHTPSRRYDDGIVHHPHDDGQGHDDLHNVDVAHEHQDVDVRAVATSAAVLVIVSVASLLFTIVLFNFFESEAASRQVGLSPLTAEPTDMPKTSTSPIFSQGVPAPPLLTTKRRCWRRYGTNSGTGSRAAAGWTKRPGSRTCRSPRPRSC